MIASPQDMPGPAPFDGIEIDAIAAIVRGCAGVSALDGGPSGEVASYPPGRTVPGVAVGGRDPEVVLSVISAPATDLRALHHRIEAEAFAHARQATGNPSLPIQLEFA